MIYSNFQLIFIIFNFGFIFRIRKYSVCMYICTQHCPYVFERIFRVMQTFELLDQKKEMVLAVLFYACINVFFLYTLDIVKLVSYQMQ